MKRKHTQSVKSTLTALLVAGIIIDHKNIDGSIHFAQNLNRVLMKSN